MARTKAFAETAEEVATSKPPAGLPPYRSESIATLTAKARELYSEGVDNSAKIDTLQFRNAAIHRELEAIQKQVHEHAWNGEPLT